MVDTESDFRLEQEHESLKKNKILLGSLLTIAGFVVSTYPEPQGNLSIVLGFSVFLFSFSGLFIFAISMSDSRLFKKHKLSLELMYFLLAFSFAVMLPTYFVSSIIMPFQSKNEIIVLITIFFMLSYVFFITIVILGALSSKFADILCSLSEEQKKWYSLIPVIFFVIAVAMSFRIALFVIIIIGAIPALYEIVLIIDDLIQDNNILRNWIKSNYFIILIFIFTVMIVILIHMNSPSNPHHDFMTNISIVLGNVSLAYNNTTVNIQNLTLNVGNVSATYLT